MAQQYQTLANEEQTTTIDESRRPSLLTAFIDDSEESQLFRQRNDGTIGPDSLDRLLSDMRSSLHLSANQLRQNHQTTLKLLADIVENNQRQRRRSSIASLTTGNSGGTGRPANLITKLQESQRQLATEIERIRDRHRLDIQRICSVLVALNASMGNVCIRDDQNNEEDTEGDGDNNLEKFTADSVIQQLSLMLDRFESVKEENARLSGELTRNMLDRESADDQSRLEEMYRKQIEEQQKDYARQLNDLETAVSEKDGLIAELTESRRELEFRAANQQNDTLELQQRLAKAEIVLTESGEEIERLKSSETKSHAEIEKVRAELAATTEQKVLAETHLKAQLERVETELSETRNLLHDAKSSEAALTDRLEQTMRELADSKAAVNRLESSEAALKSQLAAAAESTEKLTTALQSKLDQVLGDLQESKIAFAKDKSELNLMLSSAQTQLESSNKRIAELEPLRNQPDMTEFTSQLSARVLLLEHASDNLLYKQQDTRDQYESSVAEFQERLIGQQMHIVNLETQLADAGSKISDLKVEICRSRDALNSANERILETQAQLTCKQTEIETLIQELEKHQLHLGYERELDELKAEIALRRSDIASLQRMIDEREQEIIQLKLQHSKQLAELQIELADARDSVAHQTQISETQLDLVNKQHEERLKEVVADKDSKIQRLSEMLRDLESDLTKITAKQSDHVRAEELNAELAAKQQESVDLMEQLKEKEGIIADLNRQLNEKLVEMDQLADKESIIVERDIIISDLNVRLHAKENQLEQLSSAVKELQSVIALNEADLAAQTKLVDGLTEGKSRLKHQLVDLTEQIASRKNEIALLRDDSKHQKQLIADLEARLSHAEQNHQLARQELLDMESRLFEQQSQLKCTKVELEALKDEFDEKQGHLNSLESEIEAYRGAAEAGASQQSEQIHSQLQLTIERQSKELDDLRMELLSRDTDIGLLQSQLSDKAAIQRDRSAKQRLAGNSQMKSSYSAEDLDQIFSGPSVFDADSNTNDLSNTGNRRLTLAMERFDNELDQTLQTIRTSLAPSQSIRSSIDVNQLVDSIQKDLSPLGLRLEQVKNDI